MDSESDLLERIRQIACRIDVDRFVMAHGGLYLLGTIPRPEEEAPGSWSFTTQPGVRMDDLFEEALADDGKKLLAGRFLFRVEKSGRNPFTSHISLGRAKNNDIVIRHPSVSKLHAHILVGGRLSQIGEAPMTIRVMDVGSSNGTVLNGETLEADKPRVTGSGDTVLFGDVVCEVIDAGALHEKIRALFPTRALLEARRREGG